MPFFRWCPKFASASIQNRWLFEISTLSDSKSLQNRRLFERSALSKFKITKSEFKIDFACQHLKYLLILDLQIIENSYSVREWLQNQQISLSPETHCICYAKCWKSMLRSSTWLLDSVGYDAKTRTWATSIEQNEILRSSMLHDHAFGRHLVDFDRSNLFTKAYKSRIGTTLEYNQCFSHKSSPLSTIIDDSTSKRYHRHHE